MISNTLIEWEKIIFELITSVKSFNQILISRFSLSNWPYEVAGKKFPKIGTLELGNNRIEYRWHGRGCTFTKSGHNYFFNWDSSSKNPIILTPGGIHVFCESFWLSYSSDGLSKELDYWLSELENAGIFMRRKQNEGVFHLNEAWFQAKQNNSYFDRNSNKEIDWL